MLNRTVADRVYRQFVKSIDWLNRPILSKVWFGLWHAGLLLFKNKKITYPIHGYQAEMNYGYTYPVYARRFPGLNAPLLELIHCAYEQKGAALSVIDVGAAIGDTVLLIKSNCPGKVDHFDCIEGDPLFFEMLKNNMRLFKDVSVYNALLSDRNTQEKCLVRVHSGTASAQGRRKTEAVKLDSLVLEPSSRPVDILKIDVDGFDGKVLAGAREMIRQFHPEIIFEWHPQFYRKTGNDVHQPFRDLKDCGYRDFYWYDKYGNFSHQSSYDEKDVDEYAEKCFQGNPEKNWHYDVIALSEKSKLRGQCLTELKKAKQRRVPY